MIKKCQEQQCDKPVKGRNLCGPHYNRIYWKQIASPATLQNRRDSVKRNRIARQKPDYIPRHLRPKRTIAERKLQVAKQVAFRRHMIRDIVNQIKLSSGCIDCGYNDNPVALDFDHQEDKSYPIARMAGSGRPIDALIREIEKCVIRCANCHRIKTHKNRDTVKQGLLESMGWED